MEEAQKRKTNESDTKLKSDSGRRLPEGKFYISLLRVVSTSDHVGVVIRSIESCDLLKIVFRFRLRFEWRLGYLSLLLPRLRTASFFSLPSEKQKPPLFLAHEHSPH